MSRNWMICGFAVILLSAASAGAAQRAVLDPATIEGVYKRQFPNALVSGETYTSEDILEIVRLDQKRAYVRAHVEGGNGHSCSIWGVARVEGPALVYRRPSIFPEGAICTFKVKRVRNRIELSDDYSCRDSCGARAVYEGVGFEASSRRPIRYMSRLKASRQYREALAEGH